MTALSLNNGARRKAFPSEIVKADFRYHRVHHTLADQSRRRYRALRRLFPGQAYPL